MNRLQQIIDEVTKHECPGKQIVIRECASECETTYLCAACGACWTLNWGDMDMDDGEDAILQAAKMSAFEKKYRGPHSDPFES